MRFSPVKAAIRRGGAYQTLAASSLLLGSLFTVGGLRIALDEPKILFLGLLILVPFLLHRRDARSREGVSVEATREALDVGGRVYPASRLAGAWARDAGTVVVTLDDRTEVVLELAGGEADAVLAALGWSETVRTVPTPLRGSLGPFTVGFCTFVAASLGSIALADAVVALRPSLGWLLFASFALAVVVAKVVASPRVVLGADGLRVERALSRRFVRYADIEDVRRSGRASGLVLRLVSGEAISLPMVAQDDESVASVEARIAAGRARADGDGGLATLLARGGRSMEQWRSDLAALARAPRGFRAIAVTPEALAEELEKASAPPEVRVAAALALEAIEPGSPRVRVAIDTCADEELRDVLCAVQGGTVEDRALEKLARR